MAEHQRQSDTLIDEWFADAGEKSLRPVSTTSTSGSLMGSLRRFTNRNGVLAY